MRSSPLKSEAYFHNNFFRSIFDIFSTIICSIANIEYKLLTAVEMGTGSRVVFTGVPRYNYWPTLKMSVSQSQNAQPKRCY